MRLFVGDDWAEDHHDVEVMDEAGTGAGHAGGCRRGWPGSGPAARADRPVSWAPALMTRR